MASSPSDSSANAPNILGRTARRQYSWMQQSSILSQPPLRASGKHSQRQVTHSTTPQCASPTTAQVQSRPIQKAHTVQENAMSDTSNLRNFPPSPSPSDHHHKSPSPPTAHQYPSEPTARQSPARPPLHCDRAQPPANRHVFAPSSSRQPIEPVPSPSASNTPTAHSQSPPASKNAPPFDPQWSIVFQSAECTKRLSDFAAAHGSLADADLERLGILYDATQQNDWYFIILLMLLACYSLHLPSLHSVQAQLPKDSLPMFARILGEQWEAGSSLSPEVQVFISTFPKPLDELRVRLTDSSFMLAIRHISSCLHQITLNLDRVLSQCRQAATLPTVHVSQIEGINYTTSAGILVSARTESLWNDLIVSLGIRSLLLQRATFRFLLRNTWGSDSGPMAELAMREFMVEQQRFGIEGAQSLEVRGHQQNVYRTIFHQHVRSTHFPHTHLSQTTNPANIVPSTASAAQQPAPVPTGTTMFNTNMTQSQLPQPGQTHIQPSHPAQTPIPQLHVAQMEAQRHMQLRMQQMRARAQAQAQPVQPFPVHSQNYSQAASLPASAFFHNPGGSLPSQPGLTAPPHQSLRQNNTALHDAAQMQAMMMYQQEMLPQQPVLPSNSMPAPPPAGQMSRPQQARSNPPPRLFFPGPNPAVSQPAHPDYRRSALHQAHLRSPVLVPKRPDTSASAASNDLYRCVSGFALSPHRLTTKPVQEIPFQLPPEAIGRLLKVQATSDGDPSVGEIDTDSLMLRIRCCEVASTRPLPTENKWVLLDGSWPVQAYFAINNNPLEPRRKLHHGKHLPIDITNYVSFETNKLVVRINRSKYDKSPFNYAVAVEVIGFVSRNKIKEACMKRLIPPEQILDSIKKSLTSIDDDLIVQSNFTLQLYGPFSNARIFDIPVRSSDCMHKQAFDLDVFLETRLEQQSQPPKARTSKVDAWKCPICKADSRPQSLVVDGFLMAVRDELAAKNMLKTRAINVESDGSWIPIQEAYDDEEETDDEAPKRPIEVILIDD
ncbi:hypothetical protein QM012_006242 [Aureobasidium pullulans]|uniref:SP-RING-type domain-containing protein n=1 Tax=Aureobasidium pullulans TaxID=5580 RepID=A0ABR0TS19_AURPU